MKNVEYLKKFSADRAQELNEIFNSFLQGKVESKALLEGISKVFADPPQGFFPEEKLLRAIETMRKAEADGVVIFAGGIITRNKLWSALEKAFADKSK